MAVKIAVTPEYEDEKRQFHSNRLLLILLLKKFTALIYFLTFGSYAPDCLCFATIPAIHYLHCFTELSQPKPVYWLSFYFQVFHVHIHFI